MRGKYSIFVPNSNDYHFMAKTISLCIYLVALLFMPHHTKAQEAEDAGIQFPTIPEELRTPAERASYLAAHYWEHFTFVDSLQYLNRPEAIEQAVVNFIDLFQLVPQEEAETALSQVMSQASCTRNGLFFFYNTFEKYLYDLASPMRNEALFIPILQTMVSTDRLSQDDKIRPEMLLQSIWKNRVGSIAADFTYTLADDTQQTLHALSASWTLLIFFDPDCDECHKVLQEIQSNAFLRSLIEQKELALLTVYPGDNLNHWRMMQPNLPADWIVAYDKSQTIYEQELYEILGFPSIYLLDSDKTVLLKDSSPKAVETYLEKETE